MMVSLFLKTNFPDKTYQFNIYQCLPGALCSFPNWFMLWYNLIQEPASVGDESLHYKPITEHPNVLYIEYTYVFFCIFCDLLTI